MCPGLCALGSSSAVCLRFCPRQYKAAKDVKLFTFYPNPSSWARSKFFAGREPVQKARKPKRKTTVAAKRREEGLRTSCTLPVSPGLRDSQLAQGIHSQTSLGGSQAQGHTSGKTLHTAPTLAQTAASLTQQLFLSLEMAVTTWFPLSLWEEPMSSRLLRELPSPDGHTGCF